MACKSWKIKTSSSKNVCEYSHSILKVANHSAVIQIFSRTKNCYFRKHMCSLHLVCHSYYQ